MWTHVSLIALHILPVCLAFTTPSMWNGPDPGLIGGAVQAAGPAVNDFMNWAFGSAGAGNMVSTPSPLVTYHTAIQAPSGPLGILQSLPQTPQVGMMTHHQPVQPQPEPKPTPTPKQTPQPGIPPKPADGKYSMDDWLRFVAAGVAAAAVQQNMTPEEIQSQVLAAFGGAKTTETTTPTPATTTTIATTTKAKPKLTLGELIVSSLGLAKKKNDTKTTKEKSPVDQTKRGCYYKSQWYKPNSEIERGQSGSWCYGTYCNKASVVIHWDDHQCKAPITTPPIFNKNKERAEPGEATSNTNQPSPFNNMFGGQSGSSSFNRPTGFEGGSSQSFSMSTSTTTTNPEMGCIYNNQWYAPGTDIENLRDFGRCYGVYCDFKSKIVHWSDRCRGTVAPFTQPPPMAPTQSMQSMQRQMQQLESLLKK